MLDEKGSVPFLAGEFYKQAFLFRFTLTEMPAYKTIYV